MLVPMRPGVTFEHLMATTRQCVRSTGGGQNIVAVMV